MQKKKRNKWQEKRKIKWSSVLIIQDISPRKARDFVYVILYTDVGITVCTDETKANKLCLFEPYEMKGYLNYTKGGVYLVLEKAKLAEGHSFQQMPRSESVSPPVS